MEHYPEPTSPKAKNKDALPRAKMYVRARLGWLWGYPIAVEKDKIHWQKLYYPMPWDHEQLQISSDNLAQTSVSHHKIISDFPRVLPRVVGPIEEWSPRIKLKLQALQQLLIGKTVDPFNALLVLDVKGTKRMQRKAKTLHQQYPALNTLIDGFIWWLSLDPEALSKALQWLETEQFSLHKLIKSPTDPIHISAVLFALSQQTTHQHTSRILSIITHPLWHDDGLAQQQQWLDSIKKIELSNHHSIEKTLGKLDAFAPISTPEPLTLDDKFWCQWTESLLLKPRRECRSLLDRCYELLPLDLLDHWYHHQQTTIHQSLALADNLTRARQQLHLLDQERVRVQQQYEQVIKTLRCLPSTTPTELKVRLETVEEMKLLKWQVDELLDQHRQLSQTLYTQLKPLFAHGGTARFSDDETTENQPYQKIVHDLLESRQCLRLVPDEASFLALLDFYQKHTQPVQHLQQTLQRLSAQHAWSIPDNIYRIFRYWQSYPDHAEPRSKKALSTLLDWFAASETADVLNQRLMIWSDLLQTIPEQHYHYADQLDRELHTRWLYQQRDTFLLALGELINKLAEDNQFISSQMATTFAKFRFCTPKHWPIADYFLALQQDGIDPRQHTWLREFRMLDTFLQNAVDPQYFLEQFKFWGLTQYIDDSWTWDDDEAEAEQAQAERRRTSLPAAAHLIQNGYQNLTNHLIKNEQWQTLSRFKPLIEQFTELSESPPTPPTPPYIACETTKLPDNWQTYPPELYVPLLTLLHYHPNAEETAERILAKSFPRQETLQQEITALQQRIPLTNTPEQQAAMRKRLTNLQERLTHPPSVNPHQIKKLAEQLLHAAYSRLLDDWYLNCQQAFQTLIKQKLALPHFPEDWANDKRKMRSLTALLELETAEQKLAGLLLRAHLTGEDQDLRSLPANQHWRNQMEQTGINLQPWLDSQPFAVTVDLDDGEKYPMTLAFADDFFDILQMGDHFNTCLSQGDFNFFSVIANAADLNKRVVYGYDQRGRVQGRCLLAISDGKRLLSFYPYSHLDNQVFRTALGEFLGYLEQEMPIQRSDKGKISLLVAKDWYDDGAVTIMPDYPALKAGSAFWEKLTELPLEQLVHSFQEAIAPEVLTDLSLQQLAELSEIRSQPEHLLAIYHQAEVLGLASKHLQNTLVGLLLKHEELPNERIWPLAKPWLAEHVFQELEYSGRYALHYMDLLLSQDPSGLLRATRDFLKRNDFEDYYISDLFVYQGRALRALNRPNKAREAYQRALDEYRGSCYGTNHVTDGVIREEMAELA